MEKDELPYDGKCRFLCPARGYLDEIIEAWIPVSEILSRTRDSNFDWKPPEFENVNESLLAERLTSLYEIFAKLPHSKFKRFSKEVAMYATMSEYKNEEWILRRLDSVIRRSKESLQKGERS